MMQPTYVAYRNPTTVLHFMYEIICDVMRFTLSKMCKGLNTPTESFCVSIVF